MAPVPLIVKTLPENVQVRLAPQVPSARANDTKHSNASARRMQTDIFKETQCCFTTFSPSIQFRKQKRLSWPYDTRKNAGYQVLHLLRRRGAWTKLSLPCKGCRFFVQRNRPDPGPEESGPWVPTQTGSTGVKARHRRGQGFPRDRSDTAPAFHPGRQHPPSRFPKHWCSEA